MFAFSLNLNIKLPPELEQLLQGSTEQITVRLVALTAVTLLAVYLLFGASGRASKIAGLSVLAGMLLWVFGQKTDAKPAPVIPAPAPAPDTKPHRKPRSFEEIDFFAPLQFGKVTIGGSVGPDGKTEVQVDLPMDERFRNIGSKIDGAGMCTHTSIEMAARWAGLEKMRGFRDWCAAKEAGGGFPSKIDRQIKAFCAAKNIPVPPYIQYEGGDPAIVQQALKSGRMVAATYSGRDGVRYSGTIAHMTDTVLLDGTLGCIMDNNGKPEDLLWMTQADWLQRWKGNGGGWCFIWLQGGPPPVPHN